MTTALISFRMISFVVVVVITVTSYLYPQHARSKKTKRKRFALIVFVGWSLYGLFAFSAICAFHTPKYIFPSTLATATAKTNHMYATATVEIQSAQATATAVITSAQATATSESASHSNP
jgi:hypothetical protein